jgi:hypothetical protein
MPLFDDPDAPPAEFDSSIWENLFEPAAPPPNPDSGSVDASTTGGVL